MSDDFTFEEQRVNTSLSSAPKGMVGFLINKCGVKDEASANIILLILSIIIFGLAVAVFLSALK